MGYIWAVHSSHIRCVPACPPTPRHSPCTCSACTARCSSNTSHALQADQPPATTSAPTLQTRPAPLPQGLCSPISVARARGRSAVGMGGGASGRAREADVLRTSGQPCSATRSCGGWVPSHTWSFRRSLSAVAAVAAALLLLCCSAALLLCCSAAAAAAAALLLLLLLCCCCCCSAAAALLLLLLLCCCCCCCRCSQL